MDKRISENDKFEANRMNQQLLRGDFNFEDEDKNKIVAQEINNDPSCKILEALSDVVFLVQSKIQGIPVIAAINSSGSVLHFAITLKEYTSWVNDELHLCKRVFRWRDDSMLTLYLTSKVFVDHLFPSSEVYSSQILPGTINHLGFWQYRISEAMETGYFVSFVNVITGDVMPINGESDYRDVITKVRAEDPGFEKHDLLLSPFKIFSFRSVD